MSSQIVYASLVASPLQRNTYYEKKAIKESRIPLNYKSKPSKMPHKYLYSLYTFIFTKSKPLQYISTPPVYLSIPLFIYQNHISIYLLFLFILLFSSTYTSSYKNHHK